jgi:hypothetical protein
MSANDANTDLFFDVQQKTDKQHILDNPDTYIGSVESIDADMWIISDDGEKIVEKNNDLFKILATVKNDLEKTLKKPESLKDTVYQCIDLLRANTPYYSTNDGTTKIDPPLTPEQKTL